MYLLLDEKKVVLYISETIGYQSNGNPLVDHDTLAYAAILVDQVVEVENVPEDVTAMRWCYVDGEFAPNPNWVEPVDPTDPTGADALLAEALAILSGDVEVEDDE